MLTKAPDTVVAVDLYWPQFGDNSNQTIILKIWSDNQNTPATQLFRQTLTVQRTTSNQFTRYTLAEPVGVKTKFYVGWEQTSDIVLPVGYDKSNNSGNKIFFNITGTWNQDPNLTGSLMIHPVFGKGNASVVTAIETKSDIHIYPNPNQGQFYLPLDANNISLANMMGSPVDFESEKTFDKQLISIRYPQPGFYIIRFRINDALQAAKVWVRN
jgi:hypothetical protein